MFPRTQIAAPNKSPSQHAKHQISVTNHYYKAFNVLLLIYYKQDKRLFLKQPLSFVSCQMQEIARTRPQRIPVLELLRGSAAITGLNFSQPVHNLAIIG